MARCDGCAVRGGEFRLLLCRATLGSPQEVADKKTQFVRPSPGHHSVVAYQKELRADSDFCFSEIVVYENAQTYPEYIVCYRRKPALCAGWTLPTMRFPLR